MPEIKTPLQNTQPMLFFNEKEIILAQKQYGFVKSPLSLTAKPPSGEIRIIVSVLEI